MAELSRKRKAEVLDQQGSGSDGNSQSASGSHRGENLTGFELESYNEDKSCLPMGMDEHKNTPKAATSENVLFYDISKSNDPQFTKFEPTKKIDVKVSSCYDSMKPPEAHFHGTSPFQKSPVGDIFTQHVAHNVACQSEANKNLLYADASNTSIEKMGPFCNLNDRVDLGNSNGLNSDSFLEESHESAPNLKESQPRIIKDTGFHDHENINQGNYTLDYCGVGSVVDEKSNDKYLDAAESGDISVETVYSYQTITGMEEKETCVSDHHPNVEVSGTSPAATLNANVRDDNERQAYPLSSPAKTSIKISVAEKTCAEARKLNSRSLSAEPKEKNDDDQYNAERAMHSNAKSSGNKAPKNRDDLSNISIKSDGKSVLRSRKVASKIVERLWEGSLQLNTSITVSAIAYFKSGEKAPEFNWSKHVAVKGKVRLEAFEKYIQELPRSRNRALMVTSLCWRVGSSKSGLTGMKEVARDYKEEKKVGFAQLAPGVDLYACPRSDTIITILAKYGFFKGMAAVEDDQDSLIGCVVWRRNHFSSNSTSRRSVRKTTTSGEPVNSPESSVLQGVETLSPVTAVRDSKANPGNQGIERPDAGSNVLVMKSSSLVSKKDADAESKNQDSWSSHGNHDSQYLRSSTGSLVITDLKPIVPRSERDMAVVSKNIQSMKDHLDVDVSKDVVLKSTPFQDNSSTAISREQPAAWKSGSSSLQDSIQQLMKVENTIMQIMETKKPVAGVELLDNVQTGPCQNFLKAELKASKPDDDDLPEFDFGTACGNPQLTVNKLMSFSVRSSFPDRLLIDKKLLVEGTRTVCVAMPPAPVGMRAMAMSNQKSYCPLVPQGSVLETQMRAAVVSQPGDPATQAPSWPASEQKLAQHSNQLIGAAATVKLNSVATQGAVCHNAQKNLWDDDDDDMPEWCPPDLDQAVRPPLGVTSVPSELSSVHNTRSEKVMMVTSGPQFRSQHPLFLRPQSQVQELPHGIQPGLLVQSTANNMTPQPRTAAAPCQSGPRHPPGFGPDLASTPSSMLEIKLNSTRPVAWRGQRP